MQKLDDVVAFISHERSGSHLFTSFLGTSRDIALVDEVCNVDAYDPKVNPRSYFHYLHAAHLAGDENILHPDGPNKTQFVAGYLRHLADRPGKTTVVDIKYNHLHNFDPHWTERQGRPLLFAMAKRAGLRFIHLRRRHPANAIISGMVAEHNDQWHSREGAALELQPLEIKLDALRHKVSMLVSAISHIERMLPRELSIAFHYEDLIDNGQIAAAVVEPVSRFLGVKAPFDPKPKLAKMSKDLRKLISNHDEVVAFCAKHKLTLGD